MEVKKYDPNEPKPKFNGILCVITKHPCNRECTEKHGWIEVKDCPYIAHNEGSV